MSEVYSRRLRAIADDAARANGLAVEHGVYLAVAGPSYETPAEIRAFRTLGADAVGMSTVPEAIVARQMGLEVRDAVLRVCCDDPARVDAAWPPLDRAVAIADEAPAAGPLVLERLTAPRESPLFS